ncbi:hypothetical protein ABBQ38_014475 [Trebouxia sp. C0009 RCD-2024]
MHIARSPAVGRLCAGTKDSSKQARCSSTQSNSKFRWVYNGKPDQFAAFAAPRVHRASSNFHRGIHTATSKMDLDAVGPGPQLPLLPLSLLGSLAAAWRFTSGGGVALQCSTLLLLEVVYAGLHLRPLLPLFYMGPTPHAFMHSYTKATYFVSECLLLGWLLSSEVIRASIPSTVLALHGAVHIGFVVLAAQAPGWCMQQQIQRINNGWNVNGLLGQWHVLVNMVNFADLALHLCYSWVLWQSLARTGHPSPVQEPFSVAVLGGMLAYVMAQWLPQQQAGL